MKKVSHLSFIISYELIKLHIDRIYHIATKQI